MNFEEIKILFYFIIGHEYFPWFIYVLGIISVTRDNLETKKFIDALFWGLIIGSWWFLALVSWYFGFYKLLVSQINALLGNLIIIAGIIIWAIGLNQLSIFDKKFNLTAYLNRKKK